MKSERSLRSCPTIAQTNVARPPKTILEIATNVKLRDAFGLMDGDTVEVEIPDK